MCSVLHVNAVRICGLRKQFKRVEALKGIDLAIPAGEFFGLLGPNGAGKTTLIKSIVGLCHPTAGEISVFNHHVRKEPVVSKSFIGLSPQEPNVDRYFTVRKILEFHGGYYGMGRQERKRKARELIAQFGLEEKGEEEYWRISGGMQKRVMVARAMMTSPPLLILDEPTSGIDVEQRHHLWDFLRTLKKDGTTIILTTHYIDEAEELCERVAIIDQGKIVEEGPPRGLIEKHCEQFIEIRGKRFGKVTSHDIPDGVLPNEMTLRQGSLEEVFLKLTGHRINE